MCISVHQNPPLKVPIWVLSFGLIGIFNFVIGCWFMLPPREGSTVYFWFVEFYNYILFPSFILFPLSIIILAAVLSRGVKKTAAKALILLAGIIISVCGLVQAFGMVGFVSTLYVIGKVKQQGYYYYLISFADDETAQYDICESDALGFAGRCRQIAWEGGNAVASDPKIYVDESTNLVTVESDKPPFIWINSIPPQCINVPYENTFENGEWYLGGCQP
jgi:hypothetical protein